jgi:hypothetical protein
VHVLVALLYPNPTLHEVQVEGVPRQVKQSLIQVAHKTVPSDVIPLGQGKHVFVLLLYPNPTLHKVQVEGVPKQVRQLLVQVAH